MAHSSEVGVCRVLLPAVMLGIGVIVGAMPSHLAQRIRPCGRGHKCVWRLPELAQAVRAHLPRILRVLHSLDHGWDPTFAKIVFPDCWQVPTIDDAEWSVFQGGVEGHVVDELRLG